MQNAILNVSRLLKSKFQAKLSTCEFPQRACQKDLFSKLCKSFFYLFATLSLITSHIPKRVNKVLQRARTQTTFLRCVDVWKAIVPCISRICVNILFMWSKLLVLQYHVCCIQIYMRYSYLRIYIYIYIYAARCVSARFDCHHD